MIRFLAAFFVTYFLVGCAPSVYINQDFVGQDFDGADCIVMTAKPPVFAYKGSMENEFGAEKPEIEATRFICSTLVDYLGSSSSLGSVKMVDSDSTSFSTGHLEWGNEPAAFEISIPLNKLPKEDGDDILLILDHVDIESQPYVQVITYGFIPLGAIPHKPLNIESKFMFWDIASRKPIAWGTAEGTFNSGPAVTMKHWKIASRKFAEDVLKDSPFE